MKTNRSSVGNASITPQVVAPRQRPQIVISTVLTKVMVVAAVIMLDAAVILGSPPQQPATHGNNAAGDTQLSRSAYILTLPRQIQDEVAGRASSVTVKASSQLSPSAYILTLPRQIQDQVAGRDTDRAAGGTPAASPEAYLITLPRQIQDQLRQTLTARSH